VYAVAKDIFSETTIGYRTREDGELWKKLFNTPTFRVSIIADVAGVSLGGALKVRLSSFRSFFRSTRNGLVTFFLFPSSEHSRSRCWLL
jgi:hypothetical protein